MLQVEHTRPLGLLHRLAEEFVSSSRWIERKPDRPAVAGSAAFAQLPATIRPRRREVWWSRVTACSSPL